MLFWHLVAQGQLFDCPQSFHKSCQLAEAQKTTWFWSTGHRLCLYHHTELINSRYLVLRPKQQPKKNLVFISVRTRKGDSIKMEKCMGLYCPQLKSYISQPKQGSLSTSPVLECRISPFLSFFCIKRVTYIGIHISMDMGFISHVESLRISLLFHCGTTSRMFCSQVTFTTNSHKCFTDTLLFIFCQLGFTIMLVIF